MKNLYENLKRFGWHGMVIGTIVVLQSCASMSTMQTARTTEKGEVGFGFGGGFVQADIAQGKSDTIKIKAPFVEVGGRYGITDKLDIGAKLTLIGTAVLDGKYQFLGDHESKVAGSVGLGFGYLGIESGNSKSTMYDIMTPVYFSYHPADWFSIYASPKYVFRINTYSNDKTSGSGSSHWYGVTSGVRFGKRFGFLMEYSYFKNSEYSKPLSQVTGGFVFGIR